MIALSFVFAIDGGPLALGQGCNNDTVIQATKMGLQSSMIVKAIRGQKCSFDTSLSALAELKRASVPDEVISAMQEMSTVPSVNSETAPAVQPMPSPVGVPMGTPEVVVVAAGKSYPLQIESISVMNTSFKERQFSWVRLKPADGIKQHYVVPGQNAPVSIPAASSLEIVLTNFTYPHLPELVQVMESKKEGRMVFNAIGMTPTDKMVLSCTIRKDGQTVHIVPQQALQPGQYALIMSTVQAWTFDITRPGDKSQ